MLSSIKDKIKALMLVMALSIEINIKSPIFLIITMSQNLKKLNV